MRPTDENQHGSTRPNLLSGGRRRLADDDNILARLERDSARPALGHRSRAGWHVAAAALVLLLLLSVAWMALNVGAPRVVPMTRAPVDLGSTDARPSEPSPARQPAHDASASGLPPLVLLEGAKPVTRAQDAAKDVPAATPGHPLPAEPAHPITPAPAPAAVPRSHVPAAPPVTVAATARAAPRPAPAMRPRKLAVETASPDAPADTDVALLSAIIIHDSTHAAEKAQLEAATACARASERRCAHKSLVP